MPFLVLSAIVCKVNDFFSHYWKTIAIVTICLSCQVGYSQKQVNENAHLLLGEKLSYDVKYSFLRVGKAELIIDSLIHYPNEKPHYLVSFEAKSVGLLRFFYSDLLLQYETYISVEDNAHVLKTARKLKHGKKYDEDYDQFTYQDSLYIETLNTRKDRIRRHSFANSEDNIRDVLGTYLWYRQKDMSKMNHADTVFFYLAERPNKFIVQPTGESEDVNDEESLKFNLLFPGVPDMPQDKEHYALISAKTNIPLKVKVAMDVGNFYFLKVD